MRQHTKEPWYIQPDPWPPSIRTAKDGYEIASASSPYTAEVFRELDRANGNRIVACVNALSVYDDPAKAVAAMEAVVCAAAIMVHCYSSKPALAKLYAALAAYDAARGEAKP